MEMYFIIIIAMIGIPLIAQINVSTTYGKYKKIKNNSGLCGCEVARKILDSNGLTEVNIVEIKGNLTDFYDSRRKVIKLSTDIFHGDTIAAASVAAHEYGHAIQDKDNYSFLRIRTLIVPIVNICSRLGYIMIIISYILSAIDLFWVAIGLMFFTVIFQLITLPVEFNASSRANEQLIKNSLLDSSEIDGSKSVLNAAAQTYVASLLTSLLEILRLIIMFRDND